MTRTEYLNKIIAESRPDETEEWFMEFRGRGGWWLCPSESRWVGDEGSYMGPDWREAEKSLRFLLARW